MKPNYPLMISGTALLVLGINNLAGNKSIWIGLTIFEIAVGSLSLIMGIFYDKLRLKR